MNKKFEFLEKPKNLENYLANKNIEVHEKSLIDLIDGDFLGAYSDDEELFEAITELVYLNKNTVLDHLLKKYKNTYKYLENLIYYIIRHNKVHSLSILMKYNCITYNPKFILTAIEKSNLEIVCFMQKYEVFFNVDNFYLTLDYVLEKQNNYFIPLFILNILANTEFKIEMLDNEIMHKITKRNCQLSELLENIKANQNHILIDILKNFDCANYRILIPFIYYIWKFVLKHNVTVDLEAKLLEEEKNNNFDINCLIDEIKQKILELDYDTKELIFGFLTSKSYSKEALYSYIELIIDSKYITYPYSVFKSMI